MGAKEVSNAVTIILLLLLDNVIGQKTMLGTVESTSFEFCPGNTISNFTDITRGYGYASEEHTVITEDGYILTIFRIPKGKYCRGNVRRPPVLLVHGVFSNSDSWLDAGPTAGLAFVISDACYDVWVGNVRGNDYGRRNVRLDPDVDPMFWNFTTHEMGTLDIPASIDYILNKSGSDDLIYIGYSQGGRLLYIMCSETNGYCDKIRLSISLAPAVRLMYARSITVRSLLKFYKLTLPILTTPRELEVLRKGGSVQKLASCICKDYILAATLCKAVLSLIDSYDPDSILIETIRRLFDNFPAGTSARNLAFYAQNTASTFDKYDYGSEKNFEVYGSVVPPQYSLNRTTMPVLLIYGNNDFLVNPLDVMWLASQLPNLTEIYEVSRHKWNHLDDTYSQFTKIYIFPKIKEYLQKYTTI